MRKQKQLSLIWEVLLIFLIILFLSLTTYNTHTIETIEKRVQETIDKHETAFRDIETRLKDQNKDLMTEFYKLRLDWTNEKIELETKKGYVDRQIFRIYVIAGAFVLFGSIGIWNTLQSAVKKSVYEHISNLTEENKEVIQKIIECNREEQRIKNEKRILLLAKEEASNKDIEVFLQNMGFEKIMPKVISKSADYNGYDLVLLNRIDDRFHKDDAKRIVENNPNVKFFDYVSSDDNRMGSKKENVLNYANSQITLYGHLLDTLIISEKIRPPKKATAKT